jgi:hypothetical protein
VNSAGANAALKILEIVPRGSRAEKLLLELLFLAVDVDRDEVGEIVDEYYLLVDDVDAQAAIVSDAPIEDRFFIPEVFVADIRKGRAVLAEQKTRRALPLQQLLAAAGRRLAGIELPAPEYPEHFTDGQARVARAYCRGRSILEGPMAGTN